jgi:hypothetical protein
MLEKHIEQAILTYLNYQDKTFAFKVNTGGYYDAKRKIYRKNLSKFIIPGTPDVFCIVRIFNFPVTIFFEVKSETGRQSAEQKNFERVVKEVGAFYFVVRSVEDTIKALKEVFSYYGQ